MKFRTQIPSELFNNPFLDEFVTVLDETQSFKEQEIYKATRFYHPVLAGQLKNLRKRLVDNYGVPSTLPYGLPKDVLDALALNANDINSLRGSRMGLKLWLWCLTFGDITIDDSSFYPISDAIFPSDYADSGYVSEMNTPKTAALFTLFKDLSSFGSSTLNISIDTMYYNNTLITDYINQQIKNYITFVPDDAVINITFNSGVYTTYDVPYQYFVKP